MAVEARPTSSTLGTAPGIGAVVLALCVFASGLHKPSVAGLTLGDLAAAVLIGLLAVRVYIRDHAVGDVAHALLPGCGLILLGSLVGALHVGLAPWVLEDLVRDAAVVLAFFGALDVLLREGRHSLRWSSFALSASVLLVSGQLLFSHGGEIRASATFPNPNVAAHFLATGMVAILGLPVARSIRLLVFAMGAVGLVQTASFGGLAQLAVGVGALMLWRLRLSLGLRPHLWRVTCGLAIAAAIGLTFLVATSLPEDTKTTGLSTERFDRSSAGRVDLWRTGLRIFADEPTGIGPRSVGALKLLPDDELELHNLPLAYLVERGPFGFLGLIIFAMALWRLAPRASTSRALLLGFGISMLLREPSHYRHVWLVLALALVADRWALQRHAMAHPVREQSEARP